MKRLVLLLSCFFVGILNASDSLFFTPQMIASHLKDYTDEERQLIEKDLDVVRGVCSDGTEESEQKFYLATAGAPGARKTTILEKFVHAHPEYQAGTYLDPDPRTLRFMVHTYYARSLTPLMISSAPSYDEVIRTAYDKWRAASNYIVLTLLEEAFAANQSVIYGTTSTGAHTAPFFSKLKERGYEIVLLLCSCPDALRYQSVDYRNQVVRFYQSSPEDALAKGLLFPQRMGAYFTYADTLYFYWSDELFEPERLAAVWRKGELEIVDREAMDRFIAKYEADRITLATNGIEVPPFNFFLSMSR